MTDFAACTARIKGIINYQLSIKKIINY